MIEPEFSKRAIAPLFERIAPPVLDVQTEGRLVRLQHQQGEYWVLSLMLAGFKTQGSRCEQRSLPHYRYRQGFFADELQSLLDALPEHLWAARRKKRSYLNHLLARAEAASTYLPARKLWVRSYNGHYLPNPALQLRQLGEGENTPWRGVFDVLNLTWVDEGTAESRHIYPSQAFIIEQTKRRLQGLVSGGQTEEVF